MLDSSLSTCKTLGNRALADKHTTAFFCSRKLPSGLLLRAYEWAQHARRQQMCVMSGFHTIVERDVWDILMEGESPVIMVYARSLPKRLSAVQARAIDAQRLLLVSPFPNQHRPTAQLAHKRNAFILNHADEITIAHATPDSRLATDISEYQGNAKIVYLQDQQN